MKTPRLQSQLLKLIFSTASIRRWNDQANPLNFVELDKQAHKIYIAYLLANLQKEAGAKIDFEKLIKIFIYDFFARLVLTDIKPPIFYKLLKTHREEIAKFIDDKLCAVLGVYEFYEEFKSHLRAPIECIEAEILEAAHYYASKWEFDIIYNFNKNLYEVEEIKSALDGELEKFNHLESMQKLRLYRDNKKLVDMFGQLRFQRRWTKTPRLPETSVLGHTLVVAIASYLLSLDLGACEMMRVNHFFCALFHDLPEVLTRDIISPVKKEIKGLDGIIKEIEEKEMKEKIINLLPPRIGEELNYFTNDEFSNRYKIEGFLHKISSTAELFKNYNEDIYSPICGELLKVCDNLSAYIEAMMSLEYGVGDIELKSSAKSFYESLKDRAILDLDVGSLFREFGGKYDNHTR